MRTLILAVVIGCAPVRPVGTYSRTDGYSIYPATRPIPDVYTTAVPVFAKGCEPEVRLPNLISQATGSYDALVELVVQRRAQFTQYVQEGAGARSTQTRFRTGTCYEVTGVGVFFGEVDPDDELRRRQETP